LISTRACAVALLGRRASSVRPFEADIRSGTADVYRHEMPGGQYTNLREQARAMGIEHRWGEVSQAYADVNQLFGDIVKVTPTSKVVGDMALFMVANGLTPDDVKNPAREIAFPDSVISLMRGELGFPPDGFPVQFELNGQSRTVRVVREGAAAAGARPVADATNPWHVAAPMPGAIVNVAVAVGQRISAGGTLLSLEAMKMETHVTADRDAEVEAVHIAPGDRVQAKDLLIVLKALV
jgi:pyruvate carboxylase